MFSIGDEGREANDLRRRLLQRLNSLRGGERAHAYDEDCNTRHQRGKHHPDKRCVKRMGERGEVACEVRTREASR